MYSYFNHLNSKTDYSHSIFSKKKNNSIERDICSKLHELLGRLLDLSIIFFSFFFIFNEIMRQYLHYRIVSTNNRRNTKISFQTDIHFIRHTM